MGTPVGCQRPWQTALAPKESVPLAAVGLGRQSDPGPKSSARRSLWMAVTASNATIVSDLWARRARCLLRSDRPVVTDVSDAYSAAQLTRTRVWRPRRWLASSNPA
jgi:hypothetical protein